MSAYLKAFLVCICEGLPTTSALRRFLLKHPLLVIELGFDLAFDPQAPYGFNEQESIPELLECHKVTGNESFLFKLAVSSISHLEQVLNSLMKYGPATTSIVLSTPLLSTTK